jgi:hypothetical protein
MHGTTKYQISQLLAAQEVELELHTNNWCSIRTTDQSTHKLRITWFIWMQGTAKYQIRQLPVGQKVKLGRHTNNWWLIRTTNQTTHKLRVT